MNNPTHTPSWFKATLAVAEDPAIKIENLDPSTIARLPEKLQSAVQRSLKLCIFRLDCIVSAEELRERYRTFEFDRTALEALEEMLVRDLKPCVAKFDFSDCQLPSIKKVFTEDGSVTDDSERVEFIRHSISYMPGLLFGQTVAQVSNGSWEPWLSGVKLPDGWLVNPFAKPIKFLANGRMDSMSLLLPAFSPEGLRQDAKSRRALDTFIKLLRIKETDAVTAHRHDDGTIFRYDVRVGDKVHVLHMTPQVKVGPGGANVGL